jgi:hypothetical protein
MFDLQNEKTAVETTAPFRKVLATGEVQPVSFAGFVEKTEDGGYQLQETLDIETCIGVLGFAAAVKFNQHTNDDGTTTIRVSAIQEGNTSKKRQRGDSQRTSKGASEFGLGTWVFATRLEVPGLDVGSIHTCYGTMGEATVSTPNGPAFTASKPAFAGAFEQEVTKAVQLMLSSFVGAASGGESIVTNDEGLMDTLRWLQRVVPNKFGRLVFQGAAFEGATNTSRVKAVINGKEVQVAQSTKGSNRVKTASKATASDLDALAALEA